MAERHSYRSAIVSDTNNAFENIKRRTRERAAKRLLQAGALFAEEIKRDLSGHESGFPRYPNKRTGNLMNSVAMSAYEPGQVTQDGHVVRVGLKRQAFYGVALFNRGFKGFKETMDRVRSALMAIIEGEKDAAE